MGYSSLISLRRFGFVVAATLSSVSYCDQQPGTVANEKSDDRLWSGSFEAGFISATGNSESEVANIGADAKRIRQRWTDSVKLLASGGSYGGVRNTELYSVDGTLKYDLEDKRFLFANARYFDDKFDSFDEILSVAAGTGFRPIGQDKLNWDVYAGMGYSRQRFEGTGKDISGVTFLGISNYSQQLTDSTDMSLQSLIEYKPDNTFARNEASLNVAINSTLALKVAYELRYNSDPAAVDKNIDTVTKANIVYEF